MNEEELCPDSHGSYQNVIIYTSKLIYLADYLYLKRRLLTELHIHTLIQW